ncbi:type-2 ice-structuring protein-like isoform X5 [Xyrichtys novacula]|uniref:Type-2 ice-structuring protein-like isoform X5 n=1 Tax=Xyrichtys novacula TaxID=13765 RepID=A0AAV1HLM1_XYRNO|nr:type-2 ice-structuring protein-like isoform X5 [Xyrichtys novacula]
MKILVVCALVCTIIALTAADGVDDAEEKEPEAAEGGQDVTEEPEVEVAERFFCLWGWTRIGHRYFRYISKHLTWAQAENNCKSLGGHLASVHSGWEYQQIKALVARGGGGNQNAWLGGSDCHSEGHWSWTDGTCFNYKHWCRGEPNNSGGRQHCLQMNFSCRKCWDDLWCDRRLPSVCVKKW